MPDPKVALPVKVEKRGGKHVVVDADGKAQPESTFEDEGKARAAAQVINDSWKRAASERKAKGAPPITREARHERLESRIAGLVEAPWNPSLHPRTRVGEFAKKLAPARAAAKKAGVDLEDAFAPHSLSPHAESHLGPGVHSERLEQRARGASAVLESGTAIPDAVLHLPDESARRKRVVEKLAYQGDKALAKAQAEYVETPVGDLEQLGGMAIDTQHPVAGQASANLVSRQLHFGSTSAPGDYRHELGHTLRSAMSGKGGPTTHTPLTKLVNDEWMAAKDRVAANIKAGKPKPTGATVKAAEQDWEDKLGVPGSPRALDSMEEFAAEAYRAYQRSVFRTKHTEDPDYDPKALERYRKNHPGMTKLWDAWYTAQLAGRTPDPLQEAELEEFAGAPGAYALMRGGGGAPARWDPLKHPRTRGGLWGRATGASQLGAHEDYERLHRIVKDMKPHDQIELHGARVVRQGAGSDRRYVVHHPEIGRGWHETDDPHDVIRSAQKLSRRMRLHETIEESWDGILHPRDRRGRWRDVVAGHGYLPRDLEPAERQFLGQHHDALSSARGASVVRVPAAESLTRKGILAREKIDRSQSADTYRYANPGGRPENLSSIHTGFEGEQNVYIDRLERQLAMKRRRRIFEAFGLADGAELNEAVAELVHDTRPLMHLHFDPRQHPRNRLGKFMENLNKLERGRHGSSVSLPYGIAIAKTRLGRYRVSRPSHETLSYATPHGAAAHALGHINRELIARGTDPTLLHAGRIHELEQAKKAVAGHESLAAAVDMERVEEMMRRTRRTRSEVGGYREPNPAGRSKEAIEHFRQTHDTHGDVSGILRAFEHGRQEERLIASLPLSDAAADRTRPELAGHTLTTGYGTYQLAPHQQTKGFYRLAHDGSELGVFSREHGEHLLGRLHDEAMMRHQLSSGKKLQVGGARFFVEKRSGKHAIVDSAKGRTRSTHDSANEAWQLSDKLNDAVGSARAVGPQGGMGAFDYVRPDELEFGDRVQFPEDPYFPPTRFMVVNKGAGVTRMVSDDDEAYPLSIPHGGAPVKRMRKGEPFRYHDHPRPEWLPEEHPDYLPA